MGVYQTKALLKLSKYHHYQCRHQMPKQHIGQLSLSYQLQVSLEAQEFGVSLKTLEAARQGTMTLWAQLIRRVYDKIVIAGNICLLGIICYLVGQLWYTRMKIINFLK